MTSRDPDTLIAQSRKQLQMLLSNNRSLLDSLLWVWGSTVGRLMAILATAWLLVFSHYVLHWLNKYEQNLWLINQDFSSDEHPNFFASKEFSLRPLF